MVVLALVGLLPGCLKDRTVQPVNVAPKESPILPSQTPFSVTATATMPTGGPSQTPVSEPQSTRYGFDLRLDLPSRTLAVEERIHFYNAYAESLAELVLMVPPNEKPGRFLLKNLAFSDGSPIVDYRLEGEQLTIPLGVGLQQGETIGIQLSYDLVIPSGDGLLGYTGRQLNLGDWYPFIPVFQSGSGWLSHAPGATGEHLVYDLADYDITLTLSQPDPEWIVAASAPEEPLENGWHFTLLKARSFALSLSREYQVAEAYVNGVLVRSYSFPEHAAQGETVMRASADAIALFDELYGHYPHTSLAAVEGDLPDGMEYAGMFFLSKSFYQNYEGEPVDYLVTLSAHETAHNWFYGLVGNDPALEPWLDEALCTYSEALFFERHHPDLMDSWWRFRVESFSPTGWVDSTIYDHGAFRPYVNAVYLRGALFLQRLREMVGDEPFFAFLWDYVDQNTTQGAGHLSSFRFFFDRLEKHTNQDLKGLVRDFFASKP